MTPHRIATVLVVIGSIAAAVGMWSVVRAEDRRFERFLEARHCKPTVERERKGWRCDDGRTYWR